jgi:hypothetical protein
MGEAGRDRLVVVVVGLCLPLPSFLAPPPPRSGHERNLAVSEDDPEDGITGSSKNFFLAVRGDTPPIRRLPKEDVEKAGLVLSVTARWAGPVLVGVVEAD